MFNASLLLLSLSAESEKMIVRMGWPALQVDNDGSVTALRAPAATQAGAGKD